MFVVELLTSCKGRIGRLTYNLTLLVISVVNFIADKTLGPVKITGELNLPRSGLELVLATFIWAITVKRAHDLNYSGWWAAGWTAGIFAAVLLLLAAGKVLILGNPGSASLLTLVAIGLFLVSFFHVVVKLVSFAGTPGNNDYGPPPQLAQMFLNDDEGTLPQQAATAAPRAQAVAPRPTRSTSAVSPRPASGPASAAPSGFGRRNPRIA